MEQIELSSEEACFLCTLDPRHRCHMPLIEGRLIGAREYLIQGERLVMLLLDNGEGRVEVTLEYHYYRRLLRELQDRGRDVIKPYSLAIRVLHLPDPPEVISYPTGTRLRYRGNAYTLAIVEANILLNITDLHQASYCARQYLLQRMTGSSTSAATIRGNLVHYCFKELLKEYDQGRLQENALTALQRHLTDAIEVNRVEMALADVPATEMSAEVLPHLESLAQWFETERNTLWNLPETSGQEQTNDQLSGNKVRAETFLLAPEIGLRGRMDLFWQQAGQRRLLELKTGGATGNLPKQDHRWQVHGYHALLAVRSNSRMKKARATLLYSGTPDYAQAFGVPTTMRELQRVNETRSILVLNRITGIPSTPPGPGRCLKCAVLEQCLTASALLNWQPPELERPSAGVSAETIWPENNAEKEPDEPVALASLSETNADDREFFAKYYYLLQMEEREGEKQQARLWTLPVEKRIEQGSTISHLEKQGTPAIENDGWSMPFLCLNTSELREGDEILLNDGSPITGEVVSGTITKITAESVTVWARELIDHPRLIDRYDNDLVHVRTLQNLLRWQYVPPHLRDLVAGRIHPRFQEVHVRARQDFNTEQNLAIARAMQMQDYLLIHGPPGTGKTSVIAEIVKQLTQRGERVLLAAFTNQAVDNMLRRLEREGMHNYLRLGSSRNVHESMQSHLLKELIASQLSQKKSNTAEESYEQQADPYTQIVQEILMTTPVVASTIATWSSDKYVPHYHTSDGNDGEQTDFLFDVAIIDEAGQLTVPAILGALRFARRFILVGDEKQLPPLVLSEKAAQNGLADSLFGFLKAIDEDYLLHHELAMSACVPLRVQYRMNKWISHFASTVFYDQQLIAHPSIANQRISYPVKANEAHDTTIARILDPRFPLLFLDVREKHGSADAKLSTAEATAVRKIVAGLLECGIQPQDIGVIAPYRAQVAHIRRTLFRDDNEISWKALPSDTPLSVDTVDRFQGGERQVIIISFATPGKPLAEGARREFLTNPNRLNVALTRAQKKLILVGSLPALEDLPILHRLITYCRSMHTLLTEQQAADAIYRE